MRHVRQLDVKDGFADDNCDNNNADAAHDDDDDDGGFKDDVEDDGHVSASDPGITCLLGRGSQDAIIDLTQS